jgi:NtrC-family two-component system sensor histidine kinase KinB
VLELAEFRRANIGEVLRAKATLEATLGALPDAVVVIDPDGMVSSANPPASRVLGTATRPQRGRIADLPLPAAAIDAIREALDGQPREDTAMRLDRAIRVSLDGRSRALLPRVVPVPGFPRGRHGAVLVLYDVTDLVQLDEMRLELIAVASHELRTPLTTMRMTLSMLTEDAGALTRRHQDLLSTALMGVDQLAETIDEFLDLTRIEAGQLRLAWDRVDVTALVRGAAGAVQARCDEAGITLRVLVGEDVPATIAGDPPRLQVVVANVLTNAIKYTPAGGAVTVDVSSLRGGDPAAAQVQIVVMDTGRGVPPEHRERIFEKFFRVEHDRAEGDQGVRGAGIGLYLSRQIVEAHGGRISCGPGEGEHGTAIVIALPADRGAPASMQNAPSPGGDLRRRGSGASA